MAISFSRPDPSSPAAVGSAAFPLTRRGFDQGEVRDFLRMVAAELARLQERERFLESELRTMQTRGMSAPGRLDEETVTTLLGEEAARVLSTARDASTQIRERAEESATRLVKDAAEDAARIREAAQIEAARINEDAVRDAEQEIEMAKQQGRDMVNEARAYREKVLSELSRRRDAAREQIEQLLHGRDRLMNAFERARLASEDVINGLTEAHDEPEFIIDLSPTTGPVPIVNPEHPSVKPFDHAAEDSDNVDTVEVATEVSRDEPVAIETIESDPGEETNFEETIDIVEVVTEEAPVVEMDNEVAEEIAPEADNRIIEEVTEEVTEEINEEIEEVHTNVVSLFGRSRRGAEVPEIAEEVAEEVNEEVAEEITVDAESAPQASGSAVDDIFARLRESTTANVAQHTTPAPEPRVAPEAATTPAAMVIEADPERFAERDEALAPIVVAMSRKLKRVLADEQNEVLQHLKLKRSSLEMDAFLGEPSEHVARYVGAIIEDLMQAAGAGAKSMKESGGSSRRVTQKAVTDHVTGVISEGFVARFREDARVAIGEAEGDRAVLAGLMRDVYRAWKTEHLDGHIDDIACAAYGKGGFLALDPGATVAWMVDPTSPCCSECEDNSLAGTLKKNDEFPTGHAFAPAHQGCRCLVRPVRD